MVNSSLSVSVRALLPLLLAFLGGFSLPAMAGSVILIIGDGMDDHQITIARNYLVGSRGKLLVDRLPLRSAGTSSRRSMRTIPRSSRYM